MFLYQLYNKIKKDCVSFNPLETVLELLVYRYFGEIDFRIIDISVKTLDTCKKTISKREPFKNIEFIKWEGLLKDKAIPSSMIEILESDKLPKSVGDLGVYIDELFEMIDTNEKKKDAELSAPIGLAHLISTIFEGEKISSIYDPTCGNGGVLASMYKKYNGASLYGSDIDRISTKIATLRVALLDCQKLNIKSMDSLYGVFYEGKELKKFDAVVSIPPFSMPIDRDYLDSDPIGIYKYGKSHQLRSEYSFISLALHLLKDSGKAAVIAPVGVLSRTSYDGVIREALLEENIIDCVIWLPSGVFPTTRIYFVLIVFDKKRVNTDKDILLIDARELYRKGRIVNNITQEHIDEISKILKNREKSKISITISASKILSNKGNISLEYIQDANEGNNEAVKEFKPIVELRKEFLEIDDEIESLIGEDR